MAIYWLGRRFRSNFDFLCVCAFSCIFAGGPFVGKNSNCATACGNVRPGHAKQKLFPSGWYFLLKTAFRARSSRTISRQRTEAEFRKRAAFRVSKRTHPQGDRSDVPFDWEKSNTFSAGEPEATCDRTHSAAGALPESRFDECFTHRSGRHSRFDECYAHRRARPADLTNVSHFGGPGRHLSRFGPRVGVGAHLPPSIIPMSVGQTSPPQDPILV